MHAFGLASKCVHHTKKNTFDTRVPDPYAPVGEGELFKSVLFH